MLQASEILHTLVHGSQEERFPADAAARLVAATKEFHTQPIQ